MMESFMKIVVPVIMSLSLMMILSTASYNGYGQPVANTTNTNTTITDTAAADISNQTNQNVSQFDQADINQSELQIQSPTNQTNSTSAADSSDLLMKERLLNYTNDAILALNDDNETAIQQNLVQIQNTLIKAIGKPVVIVPAPAIDLDSD
ncbi:hypothetical protein [Candidatus Nitrosocosmicus sp. R]